MDYNKLLEKARKMYAECVTGAEKRRLESIFPELHESEDERIKKAITHILYENYTDSAVIEGVEIAEIVAWLEKQGEPQDKGEISDGYHTFNELYYYRMLYNAAFFNMLPKEWVHKSKRHNDGEKCFGGGWFIVMANLPTGQISNHYELKDWDLFNIPEKEVADEWDGHTPQEAASRLHKYLLEKQGGQKPVKWSEEEFDDFFNLESVIDIVEMYGKGEVRLYGDDVTSELEWLKSLQDRLQPQQKQEWSDDDEVMMQTTIDTLEDFSKGKLPLSNSGYDIAIAEIQWLKSLKPQPHWKPTEQQMNALKKTSENDYVMYNTILKSLYNDLKKL